MSLLRWGKYIYIYTLEYFKANKQWMFRWPFYMRSWRLFLGLLLNFPFRFVSDFKCLFVEVRDGTVELGFVVDVLVLGIGGLLIKAVYISFPAVSVSLQPCCKRRIYRYRYLSQSKIKFCGPFSCLKWEIYKSLPPYKLWCSPYNKSL